MQNLQNKKRFCGKIQCKAKPLKLTISMLNAEKIAKLEFKTINRFVYSKVF